MMDCETELEKRKRELLSQLDNGFGEAVQQEEGRNIENQENKKNNHINDSLGSNFTELFNNTSSLPSTSARAVSPDITIINGDVLHNETMPPQQVSKSYDFRHPIMAMSYKSEYNSFENNFTKGCKWAPDGTCLLVASEDKKLRLFNLPSPVANGSFKDTPGWNKNECHKYASPAITAQEGELIYDYAWYPQMKSSDPQSCCFAVSCRDHPVHLWDAWNGQMICNYASFDHLDEMVTARSISFNLDGTKLLSGFKKTIRVFNTARPGRQFQSIDAKGQPGIISCFAFNPQLPHIFAAGSYQGTIGIYNIDSKKMFCRLDGCHGGVTQLTFSADGTKLFSGCRKDDEILCWDIRNPGQVLLSLERKVETNQRVYFDIDQQNGRFLVSGSTSGDLLVWDLEELSKQPNSNIDLDNKTLAAPLFTPTTSFRAHQDAVTGVSIHPYYPIVATSSGQRHFLEPISDNSDDSDNDEDHSQKVFKCKRIQRENNVKMWCLAGSPGKS